MEFDCEEEAIAYLHEVIDVYAERNGTEEEIATMREQADSGYLRWDAVVAEIKFDWT
jgi:phosphoserine phosphatase